MQEDTNDCGVACLSMIIKYYQGNIPYQDLKENLEEEKTGVSAYKIVEYSKKLGFDSKGIKGDFESLKNEQIIFPCIAHVIVEKSYYHYIVLYEMNLKKQYFIVGDPSKGIYKMPFSIFQDIWNKVIINLYPKTPIPYIESNKILKCYFLEKIKQERKIVYLTLLLSFIITVSAILNTTLLNHFITLFDNHDGYVYFFVSIFLYFSFIILKNFGSYFRNKIFLYTYQKLDFEFMNLIFNEILNLPYRYYKNKTTGDMIARIEDIGIIRSFISNIILTSAMDLPLILISAICLYSIHKMLFLLIIVIVTIYMLMFYSYQKIITKKVEEVEEENAKVTSYMVESLNGYESLFGSHLKKYIKKKFSFRYLNCSNSVKNLENIENQKLFFSQMILDCSTLIILAVGIWLVSKEQALISDVILFHSLFLYFIEPIKNLFTMLEEWKKVKISWGRISNLFYSSNDIGIYDKKIKGDIEFKNVCFAYSNQKKILHNINLKIHAGNKVLITGKSGSGKSTLLKLLMRYYEKTSGEIKIDQISIDDYKKEAIDKSILYVSMKEQLFTGPLCENILYEGKYDDNYKEIVNLTEVDTITSNNSLGHFLPLEENGANLSGGERQRVLLARTLLLPFEILLLDEATCHLDINMERRILKRIFNKFSDKTIIVVSHRNENADLFDEWIEVENGKIKKDVNKCA